MKMLFSSSDMAEVARVGKKLLASGIRCEIRGAPRGPVPLPFPFYPELWVENDNEFDTAIVVFTTDKGRTIRANYSVPAP